MKKFQDIVNDKSPVLRQRLSQIQVSNFVQIKTVCTSHFEECYRVFIDELNSMEHDIVNPIADLFGNGFTIPNDGIETGASDIIVEESALQQDYTVEKKHAFVKTSTSAALGGLAGSSLSFPWNIIVGGGISAALLLILTKFFSEDSKSKRVKTSNNKRGSSYLNDQQIDEILNTISGVAQSMDSILLSYHLHIDTIKKEYKKQIEANSLDDRYKNVIEEMQTIARIALASKPDAMNRILNNIGDFLETEGYEFVLYSEDTTRYFDIKESDVQSITTYKPAIIKKSSGEIVLKGTAFKPIKNKLSW